MRRWRNGSATRQSAAWTKCALDAWQVRNVPRIRLQRDSQLCRVHLGDAPLADWVSNEIVCSLSSRAFDARQVRVRQRCTAGASVTIHFRERIAADGLGARQFYAPACMQRQGWQVQNGTRLCLASDCAELPAMHSRRCRAVHAPLHVACHMMCDSPCSWFVVQIRIRLRLFCGFLCRQRKCNGTVWWSYATGHGQTSSWWMHEQRGMRRCCWIWHSGRIGPSMPPR